ncbi:complex I subunit 1/NuoH family protein [Mucilaginibacter ginkgonis]|uniref:NADH-quinone oxidoreductase subunit H n=1 Tax=Mucilaginibacter ginkgonis TaxID=2682091 RepID=A0A6I4I196_9SPHI|nr:complex I subunit 1 family protein [Mucilaginibacter ginkgonis]QQL48472.1 NADH-quinone oxidoreductase subunit H [Mucilaginibacter ginkgonis]
MGSYAIFFGVAIGLFAFAATFALFAVYAERKLSAFIQDRIGPNVTGKYGTLQTIADILKLIQKEMIDPAAVDKCLYALAPAIIFIAVYLGFAALPWAPGLVPSKINIGLYYIFGIISIETLGILMAGWGSNNKYSILGAMRSAAQIISYEIPAGFALIAAVVICGSLDLQAISTQQGIITQEHIKFLGIWDVTGMGGILAWNVFRAPHLLVAFVIYFIASLAESNRAPFDIPEAESELVSGFHTEYTGMRFGLIFLAEYSMMFLVSMVGVILFWGSWNTPLPNLGTMQLAAWTTGAVWGIFWIFTKTLLLVALQIWIRWTLPRLRVDQLMNLSWKILTPLAFLCMIASALWRVYVMN